MEINLTEIIVALIGVCATLVTGFLIPYIQKNTSVKTQESVQFWLKIAVQAAEEIYGSNKGQEKKAFVIKYLKDKGLTFDETQIEAAVYELINGIQIVEGIIVEE